jgi:hypothetical protein
MPTYSFECACGERKEQFLKMSELESNTPVHCGQKMRVVIQPVAGYVQMECRYRCPATREKITTWKQRKESFARNRLRDASDVTAEQEITRQQKRKAENDRLARQMPHYGEHPSLKEVLNG